VVTTMQRKMKPAARGHPQAAPFAKRGFRGDADCVRARRGRA
jgi:hypothetical protein